jgi:hypothetical protein
MRIIKAMLVGATGMFILITLLSLLIPAHPQTSRTVVINTSSKEKVMAQLTNLANWKNWHPVFLSDSVTVKFFNSTNGTVGSCDIVYNNKATHLSILKIDTASLSFDLKAAGENDISNQIFISPVESLQQVRIDWVATTHLHWYPWEKFYAIFVDKLTGPGYEAALNGLKQYIEAN